MLGLLFWGGVIWWFFFRKTEQKEEPTAAITAEPQPRRVVGELIVGAVANALLKPRSPRVV